MKNFSTIVCFNLSKKTTILVPLSQRDALTCGGTRICNPDNLVVFKKSLPIWIVTKGQVDANLVPLVFSLLTKSRNRRINCGRGSGRSKIAIMQTMLATQPRRLVTRMSQYDFQNHFIRPSSWRAACFLALVFTYIVCHAWLHDWSGNESLFLVFVFSFFGTEW